MKKIFYFLMIILYVVGVIGGFGYTMYGEQYMFSAGIIACAYMGLPKMAEYVKRLMQ